MSGLLPCPFCGSPARTVLNMDDVETWAQCTKRKPSRCPMSSTIISIADWNKRPAQQPAAAPVTDTGLPELRDLLKIAAVYGEPILLSHISAGALYHAMTTGKPSAAPVSGDVALPDLPFGLASTDQLRTYGQQCSDAALERAAELCDAEAADSEAMGNVDAVDAAQRSAAAIRALKGGE